MILKRQVYTAFLGFDAVMFTPASHKMNERQKEGTMRRYQDKLLIQAVICLAIFALVRVKRHDRRRYRHEDKKIP